MKYGLSESEYLTLNEKLILPLKKYGARVFLFGSRASGTYKKFSDIDLLYKVGDQTIPNSKIYSLISEMEESSFPYKIDLVNDKDLARSYRENVEKNLIEL